VQGFNIMNTKSIFALVCFASWLAGGTLAMAAQPTEPEITDQGEIVQKIIHRPNPDTFSIRPWDKGISKIAQPTAGSKGVMTPAITYHGGPVMPSLSAVYIIWYGKWNNPTGSDTSAGQQIVRDALFGLSQSNGYTNITTGSLGYYSNGSGGWVTQVSSAVVSEYTDSYSQGKRLTDAGVLKVVENAIAHGLGSVGGVGKTPHADAVYLVLTSSDVAESSGFCSQYCGWHTYTTYYGATTPVKYAFIGNANRCLSACAAQNIGPNGNAGVDGMVSVIAHELEESVSDPLLNAWYDANGYESADKCAWTFGSEQTKLSNGAYANVTWPTSTGSTRNYLVQRALAPNNSACYINASTMAQ
jgi:hypothetical protein